MRTRQIDREEAAAQKIVRSEDEDLCDRDEAPTLSHDEAMQRVHTRAAAIYAARAERITGILVESPLRWVLLGAVIV